MERSSSLKRKFGIFLVLAILSSLLFVLPAYAVGEGNLDGGGGSMGQGTTQNFWSPGNEGVRVTVVRTEGREPVFDLFIGISFTSIYISMQ